MSCCCCCCWKLQPGVTALAQGLGTAQKPKAKGKTLWIWARETAEFQGLLWGTWAPSPIQIPPFHHGNSIHWDGRAWDFPGAGGVARGAPSKGNSPRCPSTDHAQERLPVTKTPPCCSSPSPPASEATLGWPWHFGDPVIYRDSNPTGVCLAASCRHFLATGNKN